MPVPLILWQLVCLLCALVKLQRLWIGILDRGIQIDGLGMKSFMTYESNVLFALRFMIDCNVVGGNWIEVPADKYKKTIKNLSYSQLEFDCLYSELISQVPEGEFSKMAPFQSFCSRLAMDYIHETRLLAFLICALTSNGNIGISHGGGRSGSGRGVQKSMVRGGSVAASGRRGIMKATMHHICLQHSGLQMQMN